MIHGNRHRRKVFFGRWFVLCCLFVFVPCNGILADENLDGELDAFLKRLAKKASGIHSFQAVFEQKKELSLFSQPMIFQGRFFVERPDKLRWEILSPLHSVLVFNGDKGWRCNAGEAPVEFDLHSDPVMRSVAEQLWIWVGGEYAQIQRSFAITRQTESQLHLVPGTTAVAGFIEGIDIAFAAETLLPEEVVIYEEGGDRTSLTFAEYLLDPEIKPQVFQRCAGPNR